jgi:hypothetical protein
MNPFFRYFAVIGVALVLGLTIYFVGQIKPDNKGLVMGIGGDPRMRLCESPVNGELAQPDVLAKLGIGSALVRGPTDKAAYRVSVLRPLGQESLSITVITPQKGIGKATVMRWSDGALTQAKADLDMTVSSSLFLAFEKAQIWQEPKPTIETLARTGDASSVIEVQAPNVSRCVTTRYDDERVKPLLAIFVAKVGPLIAPLDIGALVAPELSFNKAVKPATAPQGN